MTTPEEARQFADVLDDCPIGRNDKYIAEALRDLANKVERLEAQRKELREALQWLVTDFGNTSSEDVTSLKNARATLKATQ